MKKYFFLLTLCFITTYLSASVLEEAKLHYSKGYGPYHTSLQPSIRWNHNLTSLRNFIFKCTNEVDAIGFAQTPNCSGFDHRGGIDPNSNWVQENYNALLSSYPQFSEAILQLEDSPANHPSLRAVYNGRIITNTIFFAANNVFACLSHLKPDIICEIGGGYGSPAYVWLANKVHNPSVYINVDYSECLFFAEIYLKASFPDAKFVYIDSVEGAQSINLELDKGVMTIILCPLQYAESVLPLSIDLVFNTGSLQEMDETAVDFWMNWIEKSKTSYFCSCNYFGQPLHNLAQSTNLYAPRLSSEWNCIEKKINYEVPIYMLHSGHEIAFFLAKRTVMNELIKDKAKTFYWDFISNQTIFSKKTFQDAMDIIRVTQNEEIALDVLFHATRNGITQADPTLPFPYPTNPSPYIPKEALYISRWLISKSEESSFVISKLTEILHLKKELDLIYDKAVRGTQ